VIKKKSQFYFVDILGYCIMENHLGAALLQ